MGLKNRKCPCFEFWLVIAKKSFRERRKQGQRYYSKNGKERMFYLPSTILISSSVKPYN
jgi:hypothetical protein